MANKYSISKNPTGTKIKRDKNAAVKGILTKNPGSTLAYISKDTDGTAVAIVKNDQ